MNVEDMSFEELRDEMVKLGILDKENNYVHQKPPEEKAHTFKKFVEKSGLTRNEASAMLEWTLETDNEELRKKILNASGVKDD